MSKLQLGGFVAGQIEPVFAGGGSTLPVGRHKVVITGWDQKATKGNDGGMLEATIVCIEGPDEGGKIIERLNVFNKSEVAVRIAKQKLSSYCHVVHRPDWNDSLELEELCNIPFYIDVAMQKGSDKYTEVADLFDVNGFGPKEANGGQAQAAPAPAQAQPAPAPAWGAPASTAAPAAPAPAPAPAWGNANAGATAAPWGVKK